MVNACPIIRFTNIALRPQSSLLLADARQASSPVALASLESVSSSSGTARGGRGAQRRAGVYHPVTFFCPFVSHMSVCNQQKQPCLPGCQTNNDGVCRPYRPDSMSPIRGPMTDPATANIPPPVQGQVITPCRHLPGPRHGMGHR